MIFNADFGEVIIENDKDLNILLKKYECLNEEQLDNHLWYTFGISLIKKYK